MSSSRSTSLPTAGETKEAPIAASFAGTLRAFANARQAEGVSLRPSLAIPNLQKRTMTTLESRPKRPERIAIRKSPPPADFPPASNREPPTRKRSLLQSQSLLRRAWNWLQKQHAFSAKKQLRVCETVSLGEKRFVAVIQIESQKFLIGGGASGVSLLAELERVTELEGASELNSGATPECQNPSTVLQPIACAGGRPR